MLNELLQQMQQLKAQNLPTQQEANIKKMEELLATAAKLEQEMKTLQLDTHHDTK